MVPDVVLVVGPPRSGTSMVAQVVHRLGWHIGMAVPPPIPPSWRSDFEEINLSLALAYGARPDENYLMAYLRQRITQSESVGFGGRVLLKSPLLALIWPQLLNAIERSGLTYRSIEVRRTFQEREASLLAGPPGLTVEQCQEIVRAIECWVRPSATVAYRDALSYPLDTVASLATALGVDDDAAVAEAAKLILS